jgi:hypothetical protein
MRDFRDTIGVIVSGVREFGSSGVREFGSSGAWEFGSSEVRIREWAKKIADDL